MAYCRLDEVIDELDQDPRVRVHAKLATLAKPPGGRQAVANLRTEDFVDRSVWERLVTTLLTSCGDQWDEVHDAVRDVMRSDQLNGPEAKHPPDVVFGRATLQDDFARVLRDNGHHGSIAAALDEIEYYKDVPVDELRLAFGDYQLGRYVMWATFDPDGDDPFAKITLDADQIRAHLGLSKLDSGKPLLLLRYKLPANGARIARVTEAYSGETWVHYFRTAGLNVGYGFTFPWDDVVELGGDGMPEIVHKPILGEFLNDRLIEVK